MKIRGAGAAPALPAPGEGLGVELRPPRHAGRRADTLTVVVCAYTMERWPDIVAAVCSLRAQTRPVDEILLVIDHCDELAARAVAELRGLRVIENAYGRGLSGARNTGIEHSHGEVVAFLDDDAAADEEWAARLMAAYEQNPAALGVGGYVQPHWKAPCPGWFPAEFRWVIGCCYRGQPEEPAPVRNFIGANMSFRGAALRESGGFRSDLGRVGRHPAGCEETELCIRIGRDRPDSVLLYEPAALVRHTVPADRTSWTYFRRRCFAEGVSKAAVTEYCGPGDALSSERSYLGSTIPTGVLAALARGRVLRALALICGVALTVLGYASGRAALVRRRLAARAPASRAAVIAAYTAPVAALLLWAFSLGAIDPGRMTDFGLISVLPVAYWIALAVLTIGFSIAVRERNGPGGLLLVYILVLIAIVHATPTLSYGTLRYSWAWKHVAIIDYFLAHNAPDPNGGELAAYYQWPGFFTLNALIEHVTGLKSALSYASWGPPVINAAMIAPLVSIFRGVTKDRRIVWAGLWIFYCASWIGQDYFSPQGFAYVFYLVIIAALLRRIAGASTAGLVSWLGLLLVPILAVDSSHQLTPIMLVTAAVALAIPRSGRRLALYVAGMAVVVMAAWDVTAALPFIRQNISSLLGAFGALNSNAGAGVVGLGKAETGQIVVSYFDRALSVTVWGLALWGLARRGARLRRARPLLLMLAPLPAVIANNYGGEMLYRVYFFSLPGAAVLAAATLIPRSRPGIGQERSRAWIGVVALPCVLGSLVLGLLYSYYGKEQMNYFSPQEVAAAQYLSTQAAPGSLIVAEVPNYADAYEDYEKTTRIWLLPEPPIAWVAKINVEQPVAAIHIAAQGWHTGPVYFIVTDSQLAEIEMEGELGRSELQSLVNGLTPANGFEPVYRNADAGIYRVVPTAKFSTRALLELEAEYSATSGSAS